MQNVGQGQPNNEVVLFIYVKDEVTKKSSQFAPLEYLNTRKGDIARWVHVMNKIYETFTISKCDWLTIMLAPRSKNGGVTLTSLIFQIDNVFCGNMNIADFQQNWSLLQPISFGGWLVDNIDWWMKDVHPYIHNSSCLQTIVWYPDNVKRSCVLIGSIVRFRPSQGKGLLLQVDHPYHNTFFNKITPEKWKHALTNATQYGATWLYNVPKTIRRPAIAQTLGTILQEQRNYEHHDVDKKQDEQITEHEQSTPQECPVVTLKQLMPKWGDKLSGDFYDSLTGQGHIPNQLSHTEIIKDISRKWSDCGVRIRWWWDAPTLYEKGGAPCHWQNIANIIRQESVSPEERLACRSQKNRSNYLWQRWWVDYVQKNRLPHVFCEMGLDKLHSGERWPLSPDTIIHLVDHRFKNYRLNVETNEHKKRKITMYRQGRNTPRNGRTDYIGGPPHNNW